MSRQTRPSLRELFSYLGPGFLISVAYMDPGNWATNIAAGERFGYALLWVIVLASTMAMGIQVVAAKLGIATGKGIARLCRERFPRPIVWLLWAAAELAMIATDVAEILGAAIGFDLVFGLPLAVGAVLAGASSFVLLAVRTARKKGYRQVEVAIMGLVGVIALAFLFEVWLADPAPSAVGAGLIPSLPGPSALYLAIGIMGATVMPHSVYLHPELVQDRRARLVETDGDSDSDDRSDHDDRERTDGHDDLDTVHHRHLFLERIDTVAALIGAMFVNGAMLIVAAAALQGTGITTLEDAYTTLADVFGQNASLAFGIALIAAGLSSSLVATMAGQQVMDGFLDLSVSVWLRRGVTLVPSLAIVAIGLEPTAVLVASQVALSFELPFVLIPLLWFTRQEDLMGSFRNGVTTTRVLGVVIGVIVVLNGWLFYSILFG